MVKETIRRGGLYVKPPGTPGTPSVHTGYYKLYANAMNLEITLVKTLSDIFKKSGNKEKGSSSATTSGGAAVGPSSKASGILNSGYRFYEMK